MRNKSYLRSLQRFICMADERRVRRKMRGRTIYEDEAADVRPGPDVAAPNRGFSRQRRPRGVDHFALIIVHILRAVLDRMILL